MAIVKLDAIATFAAAIAVAIPALAGKITIHQAVPATIETFPNLAIIVPGRMSYEPAQRLMSQDLGGNVVVWNVGSHEGPIQLRVTTTSKLERATIEQELIDLLLSRIGSPGVYVVPVVSTGGIGWVAAFEYDDSMWMDQRAIEREYEAVITVNAVIPALLVESPVYTIDDLNLAFTENMTTVFTPSTAVPPAVEIVQINQDGSITPIA